MNKGAKLTGRTPKKRYQHVFGATDTIPDFSYDANLWMPDQNADGGATTITITFGASDFPDSVVNVGEYAGLSGGPLETTAANDGGSYLQTHVATDVTASGSNTSIVFGGGCSDNSTGWGVNSGSTLVNSSNGFDLYTAGAMGEYLNIPTAETDSVNFTTTSFDTCQIIASRYAN